MANPSDPQSLLCLINNLICVANRFITIQESGDLICAFCGWQQYDAETDTWTTTVHQDFCPFWDAYTTLDAVFPFQQSYDRNGNAVVVWGNTEPNTCPDL